MDRDTAKFKKYTIEYDPIKNGSIDGTDTEPRDRAIFRAIHSEYTPNKLVKGNPYRTVFVARLNPRTTQDTIEMMFSKYGKITHCRLVKDIVTGKSKQYAFVEYESESSAERALAKMHKEFIDGSEVVVDEVAARRLKGWKPRRLGGGFGGHKESGQLRFGCRDRPFQKPIILTKKEICSTWIIQDPVMTTTSKPGPVYKPGTVYKPEPVITNNSTKTTTIRSPQAPESTTKQHSTLDPKVKCTWEVSKKTDAKTRYYEGDPKTTTALRPIIVLRTEEMGLQMRDEKGTEISESTSTSYDRKEDWELEGVESLALDDSSDGEEVEDSRRGALLALVRADAGVGAGTFGCVLTAVAARWALTAASCIEAVEEVASLDEFVVLEPARAGRRARAHALADVQLHPLWQGSNHTYDVAALRSEDSFRSAVVPLALPTLLDYYLLTVGERMTILGFGPFRLDEPTSAENAVRAVNVYMLPAAVCRAGAGATADGDEDEEQESGDRWAVRHLSRGRAEAAAGGCGGGTLCAGVRWARGAPCGYCAGSPLLRARYLLGLLADARRACGLACEPARYASIAHARDWLDMLFNPE